MASSAFHEGPAPLHEAIADFLGTQECVLMDAQLHIRSKVEDVVLILMPWRALVMLAKLPVKVQASFSFLAVQSMTMGEANQFVIETDTSDFEFKFFSLDDLDHVAVHIVASLQKAFPDASLGNILRNASPSLLEKIQETTESLENFLRENGGPCGGFSETYAALCDYSGLPFQKEIQWNVDNLYHRQECQEFNLLDFIHLPSQDVALSVAVLSSNRWFKGLSCKNCKLSLDVLKQILRVVGQSVTLEELVLENCGLKCEFAQEMCQVLQDNPGSTLNTINLSRNLLEDRGILALSLIFAQRTKEIQRLDLSRTSFTQKGMNALGLSLASNELFRRTLCSLDLSGNPGILATEGTNVFLSFLTQPNALLHLDLSGTDCALEVVFRALASGCCQNLVHLDLSNNVYSYKKGREVPPAISQFFSKASAIKRLSLSGTKLPPEALRALLQGLAYNVQLSGLNLDLSRCQLRSSGAQVIQDLVSDASSIGGFDLSDNGFGSHMVTLVLAVSRSRSIKHVAFGRNFNIRSRATLVDTLHRIVQLTQDEDCAVESVSVAESRLKLETCILLDGLGSKRCHLVALDISGNAMGDTGAKVLAKALSVNTKLRTLIWDKNNTTWWGFLDFTRALERNLTLKTMPLPMSDMTRACQTHLEEMEDLVHKIQSYLARNQFQESLLMEKSSLQPTSTSISPEKSLQCVCGGVPVQPSGCTFSGCSSSSSSFLREGRPLLLAEGGPPRSRSSNSGQVRLARGACPFLDAILTTAEAEEEEGDTIRTGPPQAELSLSCASSAKSRPASTKDAEAGSGLLLLPPLPPRTQPAPAESLMDPLPTAGEKLEHHTRHRPRPHRRKSQAHAGKTHVQPPVRENDEDRSIARLDEGLDEFFTKKVIHEPLVPVSPETLPATAMPTPSGSRAFKKKIGHFFAFKKSKSGRGARAEKEPEGSPLASRCRKLMLSDLLRTPSKASEAMKALSKSEEEGMAGGGRGCLEQSQTPDSARRARPKYSREGKSQSLILLSGEGEEGLGVRHEKKRPLERSDGELPNSFEQRVQVMLHRIGVTKVLSSEGKKKQSKDGEIKKAGSDGDIVDSSAEPPPCALKSRTHSVSTGNPSVRMEVVGRTGKEPSVGSCEGRLSWRALGRQLNAELKGKCAELGSSPRRACAAAEPASPREQKGRERWSSSLPRIGRSTAGHLPHRRTSNAGEGHPPAQPQHPCADGNTIAGDNQLKPKSRLKPVVNRRAMSVHEEQLRGQACEAELHHAKFPLCLQRSPVLKWKIKPKSPLEPETSAPPDSPGIPPQERNVAATESKQRAEMEEELEQALEQILENAQNTALDQRTAVPLPKSPTREH
ncbi:capping protein, Arp2/3 and myosin-I linker protein 2 [Anolis sagrei]|uniref:capping protein, Arp2/3 and myosin-I linker protein 2 n=1 Tax=Anolis sagrei TaxID=38937 RepID=UPI0035211608